MAIALPSPVPTAYEQHRDYVLNVLGRRCGWLDESDREAIWHDAYEVMLEKEREESLDLEAMNDHQVRAYLTQTALNKALREGDRAHRKTSVALEDGLDVGDDKPAANALLAQDFEGARLREIVAELPERQQVVIKLRFFFDRSPDEIQSYMGVTERVYRRELERAMRTLTERFEQVRTGTFCESRRSLILGYVTGIAGPNRMKQARRHLDTCPGCAHWAIELRDTARQAGAFVPVPVMFGELAQSGDRLGGLGHAFEAARDRIADLLAGARDQATGLVVRADPSTSSALGSLRPGATVAAVASCLAVGSGATYCAVNGVPEPVRDLFGGSSQQSKPALKRASAPLPQTATSTASTKPTATPAASTPSSSTAPQSKQARRRAKAKQVEKQTSTEFGVEGSGSPTRSSGSTAGASTAPATSASTDGGNFGSEFGP